MSRSKLLCATSLVVLTGFAASAEAAIMVKKAAISDGRIILRGTTEPNAVVTLDGGVAKATADANGAFDFGRLQYVPESCVVKLTSPGQTMVLSDVKNCGPIALKSRGEYDPATSYITDELVFFNGSTWRARIQVPANILPNAENSKYWELFAVGGQRGPRGYVGPRGPQGPQGVSGPQGPQGIAGATGTTGTTGATGATGASSLFVGQIDLSANNLSDYVYTGNGAAFGATASPGLLTGYGIPAPHDALITGIYCDSSSTSPATLTVYVGGNAVTGNCVTGATGATFAPLGPTGAIVSAGDILTVEVAGATGPASAVISWGIVAQ